QLPVASSQCPAASFQVASSHPRRTWHVARGAWLSSPCVHFEMRVLLERGEGNEHFTAFGGQPLFSATIGPLTPHGGNQLLQVVRRRASAERPAQIGTGARVQAHEPNAIRGEAAPVAGLAER